MATQDLFFNIFARDSASDSFARLGRVAKASAGDVSDLGKRLNDIGRQVAKPEIKLQDDKAKAGMDDIRLKLIRLSRIVADPKITVEGALRARVEIDRLQAKLKDLQNQFGTKGGFFGRLTGGITGFLTTGPGALGPAVAGGGGIVSTLGALAAAGPAGIGVLLGVAGAAAAAAAALAPVAAALIPVTLGIGGLAAVALPELSKVFTALTATGKTAKTALAGLTPAERDLVRQTEPLKDKFASLQKSIQPQIIKAFGEGLKIVKALFPALEPLVKAAAKALVVFLDHMADWLSSPQGQSFVHWLRTVGPKDIKNFGRILWDTAHTIGDAFHAIYAAGSWIDKLVTHWHDDWIIMKSAATIALDEVALAFFHTISFILKGLAALPGPLGAPFRAAREAIAREMAGITANVKYNAGLITDAWAAIHGKTVPLTFDLHLPTGIKVTGPGGQKVAGHAAGTSGAAPGLAWVGEQGPELVRFHGGEQVYSARLSQQIARGYASGTEKFTDRFTPGAAIFAHRLTAAGNAAENAIILFVRGHSVFQGGFPGGLAGPGGGAPAANATLAQRLFPAWGRGPEWAAWNSIAMAESGWNQFATNPYSGAYGIPQALPFTKMPKVAWPAWAGGRSNPASQIGWMAGYMRSVYGDPINAWNFHLAHGWYDKGGLLPPGLSLAYNGTGRPELVVPHGRSAGGRIVIELRAPSGEPLIAALVRQLRAEVIDKGGGDVQAALGSSY